MKLPNEFSSSISDPNIPSTSSDSKLGSSPAIDRHNPIIISDSRRTPVTPLTMICSNPSPRHDVFKSTKNISVKEMSSQKLKRMSIGGKSVMMSSSSSNLFNPQESSRYLLTESILSDGFSDLYPALENLRDEKKEILELEIDEKVTSPSSSLDCNLALSSTSDSNKSSNKKSEQVVVLRVSLHCKGCAAKVRKHISRMEGVTSFNIDFTAKKVTVVGDVTPLTVLATISKVKNAQLWTSDNPILSRIAS